MNLKEVPLILFTVLSQAAVGLIIVSTLAVTTHPDILDLYTLKIPITSLALLSASFAFSIFHLGHPFQSHRSLANLRQSWLSREILTFSGFGLVLAVTILAAKNSVFLPGFGLLAAVIGVIAVYSSAKVYDNKGFPALNNQAPLLFFFCTTGLLGTSLAGFFSFQESAAPLKSILLYLLMFSGIVHLLAPCFWLLKTRVHRASAKAHFNASLFWMRLAFYLGLWGLLFFFLEQISILLVVFIFINELAGRWLFFYNMAHSSGFIGKRYP